jgi:hypothetical protein
VAVFDTEDRILRRTQRKPDPYEQGNAPAIEGFRNNLAANGQFQLPSVPKFGEGGRYPAFNLARDAQARAAEMPDFSNVVGESDTVPDASASGPKRRTLTPVEAERDPAGAFAGHVSENVGGMAESERKKRLSDIDTELFRMSFGGGLNMRSKREMFAQLMGMKNQLTGQAFDAANQRGQLNARLDTEASQTNAALREQGARRRDGANQFNAQLGEQAHQFDTEQDAAAAAAAANAPFARLQYAKAAQEMASNDAKATRDQALFDATFGSKANAQSRQAVQDYVKSGMSLEQARAQVMQDALYSGKNLRSDDTLGAQYGKQLQDEEDKLNQTGFGPWLQAAVSGNAYTPGDHGAAALDDLTNLNIDELSLYNPLRMLTKLDNRVSAVGKDGSRVSRFATDEEADALRQQQALMRRGGR